MLNMTDIDTGYSAMYMFTISPSFNTVSILNYIFRKENRSPSSYKNPLSPWSNYSAWGYDIPPNEGEIDQVGKTKEKWGICQIYAPIWDARYGFPNLQSTRWCPHQAHRKCLQSIPSNMGRHPRLMLKMMEHWETGMQQVDLFVNVLLSWHRSWWGSAIHRGVSDRVFRAD